MNVSSSNVNDLLSTVLASNSSDENKVIVTIDENVVLDENSDHISKVKLGKYYQVECKLENGIVTKIEITEKNNNYFK